MLNSICASSAKSLKHWVSFNKSSIRSLDFGLDLREPVHNTDGRGATVTLAVMASSEA